MSKYHTPKGVWLAIPTGVDISNQHSLKAGLTAGIVVRPHSGQMPSLLPQQYLEILQGRRDFGTLDRYSLRSGCQTLRYTIPCPHCKIKISLNDVLSDQYKSIFCYRILSILLCCLSLPLLTTWFHLCKRRVLIAFQILSTKKH